ncbi:MAG: hypothetical protein R2706_09045 [Acidimicrobiales bacterium]
MAVETGGGFYGERFVTALVDAFVTSGRTNVVDLGDPDAVDQNAEPDVAIIRSPLAAGLRGWSDTVATRHSLNKPTIVVLPPGVAGDALAREPIPCLLVDTSCLLMSAADVAASLANDPGWYPGENHAAPDQLRFSGDRIATSNEMVGLAELIATVGDGWPTWVDACVTALKDRSFDVEALARIGSPVFRRQTVSGRLGAFAERDITTMAQLAHFETFTPQAAAAVGGIEFAEAVLPHAPGILRTRSGLWRFVAPVPAHPDVSVSLTAEAARNNRRHSPVTARSSPR